MNDGDFRQQQEAEEERMQRELDVLAKIERAGLHEEAEFLASDLGLSNQFHQRRD